MRGLIVFFVAAAAGSFAAAEILSAGTAADSVSASNNNEERSKINNRTQDVAGAEDSVAQRRRDGLALYREAMALESGNDTVAADTVAALRLYRRAAEAGLAEAQNYLGWCLYNGIGTDADERQGVEWIERAARQGDVKACNNLGWLLSRGREVVRDYRKALYWFGKAAEAGLPQAQCQAADMFRLGLGTEADTVRARKLYRAAFAGGLRDAEPKLLAMDYPSFLLLSGVQAVALGEEYAAFGMHSVAVTLFELAAEKGEAEAFFMLGQAAALGRGVAYDYERALELYYKAALLGSRRAQRVVGETLEVFPDAFPSDRFGAEYWLEKSR